MAITKEKKIQILEELKGLLKKAKAVVFVNFHGLSSSLSQEIRSSMSKEDAKYFVTKKTLIKKVFGESGISGDMPDLEGEVALVFQQGEVTAPIKILSKFEKDTKSINLLGGVFEGAFVGRNIVVQLSKIPSKEVLLGQFLNVINAPRQQMVGVLQAPVRDFISVLRQIKN